MATSTAEVGLPCFADFVFMLSNQSECGVKLSCVQAVVLGQFDFWLEPKLCLARGGLHVYVHSNFFTREEIEPVRTMPENRGTHAWIVDRKAG